VKAIWQSIRGYILWTHARGSLQYDVMVTLILAFVFLSPFWINFKDKPAERIPHPTEVVVIPDGQTGFVYVIDAKAVSPADRKQPEAALLRVIEPIAGEVTLTRYEPVYTRGRLTAYRAWVSRP